MLSSNVIRIPFASMIGNDQRHIKFIESEIDRLHPNPPTHIIFNATQEGMQEDILKSIITVVEHVFRHYTGRPYIYVLTGAWNCEKTHREIEQYLLNHDGIITDVNFNIIPLGYWSAVGANNPADLKILPPPKQARQFNFLCYNMAGKWHRSAIVGCLESIDAAMIYSHYQPETPPNISDLLPRHQLMYDNLIFSQEVKKLDYALRTSEGTAGYHSVNYEHHANTNLSIITESIFNEHCFSDVKNNDGGTIEVLGILITEKTVRTMLARHPFIMVSKSLTLQSLREQGFKTFDGIIDESYDLIENDIERITAICNEIKRLNNFTEEQWIEFRQQTREITEHNFNMLESLTNDGRENMDYSKITGIKIYE